jgi:hypothetical protein
MTTPNPKLFIDVNSSPKTNMAVMTAKWKREQGQEQLGQCSREFTVKRPLKSSVTSVCSQVRSKHHVQHIYP